MKLFAENEHEKQLLNGLCQLIFDLGLPVEGYSLDSVIAPVFWTVDDLAVFTASFKLSHSEEYAFLRDIEEPLYRAMVTAGYEVILRELISSGGALSPAKQ